MRAMLLMSLLFVIMLNVQEVVALSGSSMMVVKADGTALVEDVQTSSPAVPDLLKMWRSRRIAAVPEACTEPEMKEFDCCCEQKRCDPRKGNWSTCVNNAASACKASKATSSSCVDALSSSDYQQSFNDQMDAVIHSTTTTTQQASTTTSEWSEWNDSHLIQAGSGHYQKRRSVQERANKQLSSKEWTSRELLNTRASLDASLSQKCTR